MIERTRNYLYTLDDKYKSVDEPQIRQMIALVLSLPFYAAIAVPALLFLVIQTDISGVDWLALALLAVGVFITDHFLFEITLPLGLKNRVPLSASLSMLLNYAAVLIFGYVAVWIEVVNSIVWFIATVFRRGFRGTARLEALNDLMPTLGRAVPGALAFVFTFDLLGGEFGLQSVALVDWWPALVAYAASIAVVLILMAPLAYLLHSVAQAIDNGLVLYLTVSANILLFSVPIAPFSILPTVLYTNFGFGMLFLAVLAVVLANTLAGQLSRNVTRSRQLVRELEALEELSEQLISAEPDRHGYQQLIKTHIAQMYPNLPVAVKLNDEMLYALFETEMTASMWQRTFDNPAPYIHERGVRIDRAYYRRGDWVGVKIMNADPAKSDSCIGALLMQRSGQSGRALDSLGSLRALAGQIAAAMYRAEVYGDLLQHARNERELELASTVQFSFLPQGNEVAPPGFDDFGVLTFLESANHTSGDFYDVLDLPNGNMVVLVADVADKGTAAALFMALSQTLIRVYAHEYPDDPVRVMTVCNERMLKDTSSNQFVTVFFAILEPDGTLHYISAGHNPAFLFNGDDAPLVLKRTGIPLGMMPNMQWRIETVRLDPGALLVAYTDGVTEAQNNAQELYGEQRLLTVLQAHRHDGATAIRDAILADVRAFADGEPQADDITLAILERRPNVA
jgi:serine phosphatase RsbU (regulator of sigma subunit)